MSTSEPCVPARFDPYPLDEAHSTQESDSTLKSEA